MPDPMLEETLRGLMRDERFAAVAGWLERNREGFIKEFTKPAASENPGKLAHAAGSLHCINLLAAQLAHLAKPLVDSGPTRTEHDE